MPNLLTIGIKFGIYKAFIFVGYECKKQLPRAPLSFPLRSQFSLCLFPQPLIKTISFAGSSSPSRPAPSPPHPSIGAADSHCLSADADHPRLTASFLLPSLFLIWLLSPSFQDHTGPPFEDEEVIASSDEMKHILKITALLAAISACWIGLLQSSLIHPSYTWTLLVYLIISLGCYGLLMVGVGLMVFPTCPHEADLLQKDIMEAKEFLRQKGIDVGTDPF